MRPACGRILTGTCSTSICWILFRGWADPGRASSKWCRPKCPRSCSFWGRPRSSGASRWAACTSLGRRPRIRRSSRPSSLTRSSTARSTGCWQAKTEVTWQFLVLVLVVPRQRGRRKGGLRASVGCKWTAFRWCAAACPAPSSGSSATPRQSASHSRAQAGSSSSPKGSNASTLSPPEETQKKIPKFCNLLVEEAVRERPFPS
mmetsp:Transcript_10218/g.26206  ORF Transcript_10218/g.26206 Transcript_10218/m.26206 type:complete len:203 (-) Transcript_10218:44-652(-)